eukprot:Selendium_serpulae@DN5030_c1_g1_i3.p1
MAAALQASVPSCPGMPAAPVGDGKAKMEDIFAFIDSAIEQDGEEVTYHVLCSQFGCGVDTSKRLLFAYKQSRGAKVSATFAVSTAPSAEADVSRARTKRRPNRRTMEQKARSPRCLIFFPKRNNT